MVDNVEYTKLEKKDAYGGPLFQILVKEFGTILYVEVEPGHTKMPHYHKEITEVFFIIDGKGKCYVDGQPYELEKGVRLIIPSNLPHTISNDGDENLKIIAFKDKPFSADNPDKHKECPACGGSIDLISGEWCCSTCQKKYSGE